MNQFRSIENLFLRRSLHFGKVAIFVNWPAATGGATAVSFLANTSSLCACPASVSGVSAPEAKPCSITALASSGIFVRSARSA